MLKATRDEKKKQHILARSNLNSIKCKISEASINNDGGIMTIIKEQRNYRELKERVRTMKSQSNDTGKINLIEEDKRWVLIKPLNAINLLITV